MQYPLLRSYHIYDYISGMHIFSIQLNYRYFIILENKLKTLYFPDFYLLFLNIFTGATASKLKAVKLLLKELQNVNP